jgi:hypothetical protein
MAPIERFCHKEHTYETWKSIEKIRPMLMCSKSWSNFKVKVRSSNIFVPIERFCHKKYTHEI